VFFFFCFFLQLLITYFFTARTSTTHFQSWPGILALAKLQWLHGDSKPAIYNDLQWHIDGGDTSSGPWLLAALLACLVFCPEGAVAIFSTISAVWLLVPCLAREILRTVDFLLPQHPLNVMRHAVLAISRCDERLIRCPGPSLLAE
jgi:hypothetical protein